MKFKLMNQKKCKRCAGFGKVLVVRTRETISCPTCKGEGTVKRNALVSWYLSLGDGS